MKKTLTLLLLTIAPSIVFAGQVPEWVTPTSTYEYNPSLPYAELLIHQL